MANLYKNILYNLSFVIGITIMSFVGGFVGYKIISKSNKESLRNDVQLGSNLVNNSNLYYVKDNRTDLCYAVHNFGWNNGLLTNVPCTDKVNNYVINK